MNLLPETGRVLSLGRKVSVLNIRKILKGTSHRNILIIKATTAAFLIILLLAIIASILIFSLAPDLTDQLSSLTQMARNYADIPSPFTGTLFLFIFLNNIGHFWNPIRMLVWIPLIGPFLLGFEILLNSGLIGMIAVIVGINNGVAYPIVGLVPHGIIEIPGFLLQFASIVLWQVTISEALVSKMVGRKLDRFKVKQHLKDTFFLATTSIILLMVAAVIETYVTPYLLGL